MYLGLKFWHFQKLFIKTVLSNIKFVKIQHIFLIIYAFTKRSTIKNDAIRIIVLTTLYFLRNMYA